MDYEKQAKDFCKKYNVKIQARYIKYAPYNNFGDDTPRDIWQIKLSRQNREYIFTFGDSIANREKLIARLFHDKNTNYIERAIEATNGGKNFAIDYSDIRQGLLKYKKHIDALKNWQDLNDDTPSHYDILACLNGYEPSQDIDDFAQEFGYDKPSQAIKVFKAVQDEYTNLKILFNNKELDALNNIQ